MSSEFFNFSNEEVEEAFKAFVKMKDRWFLDGQDRVLASDPSERMCIIEQCSNPYQWMSEDDKKNFPPHMVQAAQKRTNYVLARERYDLNPTSPDAPDFLLSQELTFSAGKDYHYTPYGYYLDTWYKGKDRRDQDSISIHLDDSGSYRDTRLVWIRSGLGRLNISFSENNMLARVLYLPYRYYEQDFDEYRDECMDIEGRPSLVGEYGENRYQRIYGNGVYDITYDRTLFRATIYDESENPAQLVIPQVNLMGLVTSKIDHRLIENPKDPDFSLDKSWMSPDPPIKTGIIWRRVQDLVS